MPALLPAPGAVEVQLFMLYRGRTCSIRLFYGDGSALEYTLGDVTALATNVAGTFASDTAPRLSDDVTGVSFIGTDLFSNTAPRFEDTWTWTGGQATEGLPLNVAFVLKRIQDRRYRGGKSHVYIPGLPMNVTTDESHWTNAIVNAIGNDFNSIDNGANALTTSHGFHWVPICVSRRNGNAERVSPVLFHVVANQGQDRICTRRRRLPKITT